MKNLYILIALLLALSIFPQKTYAAENHSGSSAQLIAYGDSISNMQDPRVLALKNVFNKYNSPLTPYADLYIKHADKNGVDWKLLPAISGLESSFGRYYMPGSHNVYGWGGGYIYFQSWEEGIKNINKALKRNYIDKGADNVYSIGPIYAESPTWAVRVNRFMEEINQEYIKISTSNLTVTL
ncbi:hypothetical protein C4577_05720 [Candidatus Parcubacteria bacterium]|nr:MAG: hypothetical protein C4577_05720 [Candidatus Parcubacteria bacterium]